MLERHLDLISTQLQDGAQWFKIRNRKYSEWAGGEKFFERERDC